MRRQRRHAQDLRLAIDCMPATTRQAMLDGIQSQRIIVGAYTDRQGGVCPMLAAHRHGGRTALASFARAWDRYTNAHGRPRPATERELRTLKAMLQASLYTEDARSDLTAAVSELKAARERRAREGAVAVEPKADTGERDRTPELKKRPGWAWMRIFRRYDAYKAALDQIEAAEREERRDGAEQRERELV
jgi:hypothetical protein